MKVICFFMSVYILYGMGSFMVNVEAQDTKLPLIIEPIYPQNQNPQTVGYFDLSVSPGDKQSLSIRITNKEEDEVTVSIKSANAFTNPTGGMMYEKKLDSPDTVLLNDAVHMADHIEVQETITVPPLSSVDVPIGINVPKIEGQTLLGGILFTTQGEETEKQQEVEEGKASFVLKTEMINAIAIQLNFPNKVDTNFQFGESGFIPETTQVYMEMTNNAQKIQEEIKGTYAVTDENGKELFHGKFGAFKMAPKSKIRHPFQWGDAPLEDGTYTVAIEGTVEGEKVSTSDTFTINNKDVEVAIEHTKPNQLQANVNKGIPTWVWVVGALLFGILMFLVGKKKS
jgi:hypothetical protein